MNVTVKVKEQKDEYDPQPSTPNQEVSHEGTPDAGASVNKTGLPEGTTYEWETPVNTNTPGDKPGVVVVKYPDGTKDKVNVTVKVKDTEAKGDPEVQPDIPEFNGGVNGEPEVQPDLPEFNGGVNGELPDPVELPKVKLIITKWVDEKGNELKPADAKAPTVLGEANEALEAGEIEGYVFVRTEVKDDVVTHIFRKVTPSKPEGNGEEHGEGNKPQLTGKVEKTTKRLANTGEAETNTGLAGLGLAVLGSLLAVAKRRKKDEE